MEQDFNNLIQPEYSLGQLRRMIGSDLSGHDLDGPFPRHLVRTESELGVASRFRVVRVGRPYSDDSRREIAFCVIPIRAARST